MTLTRIEMKIRAIIIWIFILIIIDQLIKILIYNFYLELNFEIIPSILEFRPSFNIKHSWINSLLSKNAGINVGLLPHVVLYLLIGFLIPMYFSYFRNNIARNKKLIDIALIFLMATIVCALIGNIMWNKGTLDYVYLKSFFVFDLKDFYADLGVAFFLFYAFRNRKQLELMKNVKMKDVYRETKFRLNEIRNNNAST